MSKSSRNCRLYKESRRLVKVRLQAGCRMDLRGKPEIVMRVGAYGYLSVIKRVCIKNVHTVSGL